MPKITITFQEEGDVPSVFEVPAEATAMLEAYIATQKTDEYIPRDAGNGLTFIERLEVPKYKDKTDLFYQHVTETLIKPIIDKYGHLVPALSTLEQQKQQIEDAIKAAKEQAIEGVLTPKNAK